MFLAGKKQKALADAKYGRLVVSILLLLLGFFVYSRLFSTPPESQTGMSGQQIVTRLIPPPTPNGGFFPAGCHCTFDSYTSSPMERDWLENIKTYQQSKKSLCDQTDPQVDRLLAQVAGYCVHRHGGSRKRKIAWLRLCEVRASGECGEIAQGQARPG
jgi:hypothetical protein